LADSLWIAGEKEEASLNYKEYLSLMKSQKKILIKYQNMLEKRIK
jgi:hypothetical protein